MTGSLRQQLRRAIDARRRAHVAARRRRRFEDTLAYYLDGPGRHTRYNAAQEIKVELRRLGVPIGAPGP